MATFQTLPKRRKPKILASLGNKLKSALEYGTATKYIFDMGKGIYQGLPTCGPMVYTGLKASGPTAATIASL